MIPLGFAVLLLAQALAGLMGMEGKGFMRMEVKRGLCSEKWNFFLTWTSSVLQSSSSPLLSHIDPLVSPRLLLHNPLIPPFLFAPQRLILPSSPLPSSPSRLRVPLQLASASSHLLFRHLLLLPSLWTRLGRRGHCHRRVWRRFDSFERGRRGSPVLDEQRRRSGVRNAAGTAGLEEGGAEIT